MLSNFYYHPRMLSYDFGPAHPLRPERLRRAIKLMESYGAECIDPGLASEEDVLRVHAPEYVRAVKKLNRDEDAPGNWGLGGLDTPPYRGMYESSLAYCGGSVAAAKAVNGGSNLAFNISGGLHHARRAEASGFCVFNDAAIACHVLREKFGKVAYIDIDVHHGDGVQWIFYQDPTVLTCSIHEDGRTIYPGTGFVDETGAEFSAVNVPIPAHTTGDVWLDAFKRTIIPAVAKYAPGAIVLQMGTDTHFLDRLGHLKVSAQEWLEAVKAVTGLGLPIVALGGGGYNLTTVPRMWTAACLTLANVPFNDLLPSDLIAEMEIGNYFDADLPPREQGRERVEEVVMDVRALFGL